MSAGQQGQGFGRVTLVVLLVLGVVWAGRCHTAHHGPVNVDKLVDAIHVAEGVHSRYPYGVVSVKVHSEAEARTVCRTTVVNNLHRWEQAGRPGGFVEYLADHYCAAAGRARWLANVNRILGEKNQ